MIQDDEEDEPIQDEKPFRFDLTGPCSNCPFRLDQHYLRRARAQEIADALCKQDLTFTCHKTTGVMGNDAPAHQHCAGALVMMQKSGRLFDNWRIRFAAFLGLFKPERLNMNAPVYDSPETFVQGHE